MVLIRRLVSDYSNNGDGFRKVQLKKRFFELTLNVMMRMIAGKRYCGEDVEDSEEARRFQEIVEETFALSAATNPGDFLPVLRFLDHRGAERKLERLQEKRDAFMQRLIDENRRSDGCSFSDEEEVADGGAEGRRKTIVDVLLSLQRGDPEYYTDEIIKGLLVVSYTFTS